MPRLPIMAAVVVALMLPGLACGQSEHDPYIPLIGKAQVAEGDVLSVNGTLVRLYGIHAPRLAQFWSPRDGRPSEIRRASSRDRVWSYVLHSLVAESLKQ